MSTIQVDFADIRGKMKIMHSVNNGPAGDKVREALHNFDLFRDAQIPYARTHDAALSEIYCGEHIVDVHRIFRNFDADPEDPASYDFAMTDAYIGDIVSVGTRPFYRLGAAIEHRKKVGTYPPRDFLKWARICEHIIRHYNEGWADGFRYGIEYWEIWNEPDCRNADGTNPCWQGTREAFIDLFVTAYRHLKTCFPDLKIGGPAFCSPWVGEYNDLLFGALDAAGLTLDFYSFHGYRHHPYEYAEDGEEARRIVEKFGCADKTELILNEWNYCRGWLGADYEHTARSIKGLKGSSFITGTMCVGQASPIDHLMYYDARPCIWSGMFDSDFMSALKGYYPFLMYGSLYRMGQYVSAASDDRNIYCTAARGEKEAGLMFTYYDEPDDADPSRPLELSLHGLEDFEGGKAEFFLLDETHDMESVFTEEVEDGRVSLAMDATLFGSWFVRIVKD